MNTIKINTFFLSVMAALLFVATVGCTRKVQETSVIQLSFGSGGFSKISEFEYSEPMSMQSASAQGEGDGEGAEWNPALNPANLADVNCYMITVSGPEADMQRNTCVTKNGTNLKVGRWHGGIPAGGSLSLEVPSGAKREITVVGFKASAGACTNFKTTDVSGMSLSEPHILGKIVKDLAPGSVAVSIPVSVPVNNNSLIVDDCAGPDFNMEQAPLYFGDATSALGVTTVSSTESYTSLLGSSFQLVNFNPQPSVPNEAYTRLDAPTAPSNLSVGDEVMITIQGASGSWIDDVGPCGYRAWEGRYSFGRVMAISGTQIYISKGTFVDKMSWNPNTNDYDETLRSTIAGYLGSTPDSAGTFCKMRVSKVLHFWDLTIDTAQQLVPDMFEFNAHTSGLLPIRVANNLTFKDGSAINASGLGYMPSSTNHGTGIRGHDTTTCSAALTSTITGGSCSPGADGAGGGGHGNPSYPIISVLSGGAGGGGANRTGGYAIGEDCGDGSCFGDLKHKMFMGGGGGSSYNSLAGSGGSGGGMIYLMAKNIIVEAGATGSIVSNGDYGDTNSSYSSTGASGGGAGGSILLGFKNLIMADGSSSLAVSAAGGLGGSSTATGSSGGGGGGGGRVHYIGCSSSSTSVNSSAIVTTVNGGNGGSFGSGGAIGAIGLTGSVLKQSVPCD